MSTSSSVAVITNGSPRPRFDSISSADGTSIGAIAITAAAAPTIATTTTTPPTTSESVGHHNSHSANENLQEADVGQQARSCGDEHQAENHHHAADHVLNIIQNVDQRPKLSITPKSEIHFSSTLQALPSPSPSDTTITTDLRATDPPRLIRSLSGSRIDIARSNSLGLHSHPSPISPAADEFPPTAIRKTSPGLAARLKALGFGTSKKTAAPPPPESIGRLDEQQLRQLDEKHQANSISAVISRRGRPWKGAGSFPALHKSVSQPDLSVAPDSADPASPADTSASTTSNSLLPEIRTPTALNMDTNKYRLPDDTNGNCTKVAPEVRVEHLERNTPPSLISSPKSPPRDASPLPPPPPPPPPAASAPPLAAFTSPTDFVPGLNSYFSPGHNRPGSIYTLSRSSFANQLAQLTQLQLPDAESLSSKISAIPAAPVATTALINAAEQMRSWISKAQEVVSGLDSEDDVEWAAAGGREGLEEVENAIARFQALINAYVGSIDQLQRRGDVANVTLDDLNCAVSHMEAIVQEWTRIRGTLQNVRMQVEIAMEWEELWNNVLGDIQEEMDELSRLVFEMEERRHKSLAVAANGDGLDINDLETIVEENPSSGSRLQASNRFSIPVMPPTPSSPGTSALSQDDSNLLALFARMQPLRASLDFLPMRLSVFETRAEHAFPTACEELKMRREGLDASYKKLEKDAESLRKELGEDRWVIVFRGAGRQAQKMHESVERSLIKLKDAVDAGMHLTNQPSITKKIEGYEAKKTHYGPAIERVLGIIDKGVQDRLTVNGEILRLRIELQSRWEALKTQIHEMDVVLEDIYADRKSQQLRDSVSSMLSMDHSNLGSPWETPGSSPPSSVIMSGLALEPRTPGPKKCDESLSPNSTKTRTRTLRRRQSSLPAPIAKLRTPMARLSTMISHPEAPVLVARPESSLAGSRPRWNTSTNTSDLDVARHQHAVATPSAPVKMPSRSSSAMTPSSKSKLPTLRHSFSRSISESPKADERSPRNSSRLSFRDRLTSPGPQPLHRQLSSLTHFRSSIHPSTSTISESPSSRPSSSLASRRESLMPQTPKRNARGPSPLPGVGRFSSRKNSLSHSVETKDAKPRWRF